MSEATLKVVTQRARSRSEMADLLFAFRVCKHVKSNAIVYAKDLATTGIGAGQMNRAESSRIAAWKGEAAAKAAGLERPLAEGSVVASDAFFPFADGLEIAASAGATAVIQPGGSIRDAEVIAAADKAGLCDGLHRDAALPALNWRGHPAKGRGAFGNLRAAPVRGGGSPRSWRQEELIAGYRGSGRKPGRSSARGSRRWRRRASGRAPW